MLFPSRIRTTRSFFFKPRSSESHSQSILRRRERTRDQLQEVLQPYHSRDFSLGLHGRKSPSIFSVDELF